MTTEKSTGAKAEGSPKKGPAAPDALIHSLESEKLLISAVLNERNAQVTSTLLSDIAPTDFYLEAHAAIWRSVMTLYDNRMSYDVVSVIDHARAEQAFSGGADYIFGLAENVVAAAASEETIKGAAKRVKSFSIVRALKGILVQGLAHCESGAFGHEQILSLVEDDMVNLRKKSESNREGPVHIRKSLDGLMERLERQMDGEQIGVGVSTGFESLDEITSGLIDEDFIILAARPSMGKTAMALNLARNGAAAGQPSLIFSLEMKEMALAQRLLGRESRVNLQSLRTASLNDHGVLSRLTEGVHRLGDMPIFIDDTPSLTINEIRSRARAFVMAHGKCTVYVDYIQHVAKREDSAGPKTGSEDRTHVSNVSGGLKGLARELKIPVVGLSQLNRNLEQRSSKRPIMADLSDSGSLERDADLILFLYRDEVYNPETQDAGLCEVIVGKQRDGAVGTIKLAFQKETGLFFDMRN
jgi:replicative DNA helicase